MASLLKMDIKDLFKKKKSSIAEQNLNKVLIQRIVLVVLLLVGIIGLFLFVLKPMQVKQDTKIQQMETWKKQIESCKEENKNLNILVAKLEEENKEKGRLFVSDKEFKNFYAELTQATITHNLTILSISRGDEEMPVFIPNMTVNNEATLDNSTNFGTPCNQNIHSVRDAFCSNNPGECPDFQTPAQDPSNCVMDDEGNCGNLAYYKMMVNYEIRGSFIDYLNFRDILAKKRKIVNIEKEVIAKNENAPGIITKATVSLVKGIQ